MRRELSRRAPFCAMGCPRSPQLQALLLLACWNCSGWAAGRAAVGENACRGTSGLGHHLWGEHRMWPLFWESLLLLFSFLFPSMERGKEEWAESSPRAVSIGSAQCWQRVGRTGLGFAQGWCEVSSHPLGSACSPPRAWRKRCPPPPPLPVSLEPPGAGKQTEWGSGPHLVADRAVLCKASPAQQHPVRLDGAQPGFTLCSKEPQRGHSCFSSVIIQRTLHRVLCSPRCCFSNELSSSLSLAY